MDLIKVGDIVSIRYVDGCEGKNVTVWHVPYDIGNMWIFERNEVIIVQNPMSSNLDNIFKESAKNKEGAKNE